MVWLPSTDVLEVGATVVWLPSSVVEDTTGSVEVSVVTVLTSVTEVVVVSVVVSVVFALVTISLVMFSAPPAAAPDTKSSFSSTCFTELTTSRPCAS